MLKLHVCQVIPHSVQTLCPSPSRGVAREEGGRAHLLESGICGCRGRGVAVEEGVWLEKKGVWLSVVSGGAGAEEVRHASQNADSTCPFVAVEGVGLEMRAREEGGWGWRGRGWG
jgi:hypothetical protein